MRMSSRVAVTKREDMTMTNKDENMMNKMFAYIPTTSFGHHQVKMELLSFLSVLVFGLSFSRSLFVIAWQ